MPSRDYQPRAPRPNLLALGFECVAAILTRRMRTRRGTFYCFVLPNGTTYLRETTEMRTSLPSQNAWVGTYTKNTPVEMIESDLLDRQRELNSRTAA